LISCGTDSARPGNVSDLVIREHYNVATPDPRLRSHLPRPGKRPIKDSNAIAKLFTELYAWGDDLTAKLEATWQSIDDAKARADQLNNQQTTETPQ